MVSVVRRRALEACRGNAGALRARTFSQGAAVLSIPSRRACFERAATAAHVAIRLRAAHASAVLVAAAGRVVAQHARVTVVGAGAAACSVGAVSAEQIGTGMAREAVARGRALALTIEIAGAGDVGAWPRLGLRQTTRAPEAFGTIGARRERHVVVGAGVTEGRHRVGRTRLARVSGTACEARRCAR